MIRAEARAGGRARRGPRVRVLLGRITGGAGETVVHPRAAARPSAAPADGAVTLIVSAVVARRHVAMARRRHCVVILLGPTWDIVCSFCSGGDSASFGELGGGH